MAGLHVIFRSIPAIASFTIVLMFLATFRSCYISSQAYLNNGQTDQNDTNLFNCAEKLLQIYVALYITLMHVLTCVFPLRVCWAIPAILRALSSPETKFLHSTTENKVDDEFASIEQRTRNRVTHAVLLPSYKEDIDTLRDSLNVLASHPWAKVQYDIFLAMEERDPNAESIAQSLIVTFRNKFKDIQYTIHPVGLRGEAPGKSSNVSWAASKVGQKNYDESSKRTTLITVMDSDTHLLADYFEMVTNCYERDSENGQNDALLYVPPIIFDRNAHKIPTLVRVADILWTGASLSGTYPGSSVCIPTSVYSLPLSFAERIGGWDGGPEAIGEDLHMFLKCFFSSECLLKATPIFSPASHCNVTSSETGLRGFALDIRARGKQAVRHMWGSLDSGYAVRQGLLLWRRQDRNKSKTEAKDSLQSWNLYYLYHRLFEAHFLPLQFTLCMLAPIPFSVLLPADAVPWFLALAFRISSWLRVFGFFFTCSWIYLYEHYHHQCVSLREREMQRAGLFEQSIFSWRRGPFLWMDYLIFPVAGTMFGSVPAAIAQTWHIWTDRLDYTVSSKPTRNLSQSVLH